MRWPDPEPLDTSFPGAGWIIPAACTHARWEVRGLPAHTQRLSKDQICVLYSLSKFISFTSSLSHYFVYLNMLRSQNGLRPVGMHALPQSLLSDTRMDSTFGEVHLSSTGSLFAQWATDGVSQKFFCASLLSDVYSSLQPEYCRIDCFADNPVAVGFCVRLCVCL